MNEVWNLDPIYQGFDDPAFARDVEALQLTLSQLEAFVKTLGEADPAQGLRRGLELQEALAGYVMKLAGFAELKQAANTLDAQAGSQLGRILGLYSESAAPIAAFEDWAARIPNLQEQQCYREAHNYHLVSNNKYLLYIQGLHY